jgi:hypothetical protein
VRNPPTAAETKQTTPKVATVLCARRIGGTVVPGGPRA